MLLQCALDWYNVEEEIMNTLNLESLQCLYLCLTLVEIHENHLVFYSLMKAFLGKLLLNFPSSMKGCLYIQPTTICFLP